MKKKYYQCTFDGEVINEFNTLQEACDVTGVPLTTIWELINGKKKNYSGEFLWSKEVIQDNGEKELMVPEIKKPKILFFDLESTPMVSYNFGLFKQNIGINQVIEKPHLITWAAKWAGDEDVFGDAITSEEILAHDDKRITQSLWRTMNKADIIVAHYGNKFDIPLSNTRFVVNGLPPLSPFKSVDTKQIASRYFKMYSNKLDALAELFGMEGKIDTTFDLWKNCMLGKQQAIDNMFTYNMQDVVVLEKVYNKLLPYASNHPNVGVYNDSEEIVCSRCGGTHLIPIEKEYKTSVSSFKTVRCQDCGAISRERTSTLTKVKRKSLLTNAI